MQKQTFWRDPFINSSIKKNTQTQTQPPSQPIIIKKNNNNDNNNNAFV